MNKKIWLTVGVVVVALGIFAATSGSKPVPAGPSYAELAQQRFDGIEANIPELKDIQCLENSCDNSVVYFDFDTAPSDLETIMRGNAAAFSKFSIDNGHGSHVSIIARVGNNEVFQCDASDGSVDSCK